MWCTRGSLCGVLGAGCVVYKGLFMWCTRGWLCGVLGAFCVVY